jgi:hypothetical protein
MGLAHNSPFQEEKRDATSTAAALKRGSGAMADLLLGSVTACQVGW